MGKRVYDSNLMSKVTVTQALNTAFKQVYSARKKDSPNSELWNLSLDWDERCDRLVALDKTYIEKSSKWLRLFRGTVQSPRHYWLGEAIDTKFYITYCRAL
ncbi:MAG: hypothetical protein A3F17_00360 [Gammaproteobacteria bacterium RIFCSPHIGHO2_12_FULL_41_15]|nr:MAG: hypothetical protein A3F17_00360 [Gammaproteobacteria bacterium RIFCSPHIGHO2_12_FULL_41_15]